MYLGAKLSKARPGRPATRTGNPRLPGDFDYFGKHLIKSPGDTKFGPNLEFLLCRGSFGIHHVYVDLSLPLLD